MHYAVRGSLPRKHILSICSSYSGTSALRHFVIRTEYRHPFWHCLRYTSAPRVRRELYSTAHMKAKCSRRLCLSVRHNASVIDQVLYSITSQLLHIILHVYIHIVQLIKCHVHLANIGAVHTYSYIYIISYIYTGYAKMCILLQKVVRAHIWGSEAAISKRYRVSSYQVTC